MRILKDCFSETTVGKDFFKMLCGDIIGSGAYREVYEFTFDSRYVIKFENVSNSFSNIQEWDIWNCALDLGEDTSKWLAPCHSISPCGTVLLQRKTKPIPFKKLPKDIPIWFEDTKCANFGTINGKFVAHDYGNNSIFRHGMSKRLKKAEWW